MGLQKVKSEILDDAQKKADRIVEEAEVEAEEIVEEAEKEAEKIRESYREELEDEKEAHRKKAVSNARMKAKQEKLRAKEEKIREVFEDFREEMADLSDEERKSYVERCIEKADFEPGKVLGAPEYSDYVDVEFEEEDIDGIVIVSEDGEKRQDFSFDKVLERFKDRYRKKVSDRLFGD